MCAILQINMCLQCNNARLMVQCSTSMNTDRDADSAVSGMLRFMMLDFTVVKLSILAVSFDTQCLHITALLIDASY